MRLIWLRVGFSVAGSETRASSIRAERTESTRERLDSFIESRPFIRLFPHKSGRQRFCNMFTNKLRPGEGRVGVFLGGGVDDSLYLLDFGKV